VNGCFCTQDQPVTFTDAQLGKVSPLLAEAYRDIKQLMASGAHVAPLAGNDATMSSSDEELLSKSNQSNCVKDVSGAADSNSTPGVRLSLSQKQVARPASAVVDTVSATAMGGMNKSQSSLHGRGASGRGKLACSVSTVTLQAKQNAVRATRDARRDHHPHSMEHAERAVRNALRSQHPQRGDWTRRKAYDDLLRKRRLRCSSKACPAIGGQHSGHRSADMQPTELVAAKDCWLPSDVRACEGLLLTSPCIASSQQEEHSSRPLGTVTSQGERNGLLSMPSCIASSQQEEHSSRPLGTVTSQGERNWLLSMPSCIASSQQDGFSSKPLCTVTSQGERNGHLSMPSCIASSQQDGYSSKPLRTVTSKQEQAGGLPSKPSECISDVVQNTLMVQNLSENDGTKKWQPAAGGGGEAMHGGGSTGASGCLRNGNNHQTHKGAVKGNGGSQDCIGTARAGAPHSASPLCQSMSKCTSPVHGEISEGQRFRPRNPDILGDESVCEDDLSVQMMPFPESPAEQQEHIWRLQKCKGGSKCPQSRPFHCTEDLQDASTSHAQARVLNGHALEVVDSVTGCFSDALAKRTSVPSDCSKGGQKVFTDPSPGTFTDGFRNLECHSQFERHSCCPELQCQISMYRQHHKNSTARLGAPAICAPSPATGGHGCSDLGSCLGTTLTASGAPEYGQEAFTEGTCATATHAAQDSCGMFAHPCLPPAGGDALAAVPSHDVSTRTIQGVDCSSDVVKPAQMDGENVAVSATLGEDLAAGPTFGESAAMRPTIEKTAAASTTAENAVATPSLGDNSDTTPALGENAPVNGTRGENADATPALAENADATPALAENAAATPKIGETAAATPRTAETTAALCTPEENAAGAPKCGGKTVASPVLEENYPGSSTPEANADATCAIKEHDSASPVLGENANVNLTLGEAVEASPAHRENDAAVLKTGQSAAATPACGAEAAATCEIGQDAGANLALGENAQVNPTLGGSVDATPALRENAAAAPKNGQSAAAAPTNALITAALPTLGENAAASLTLGQNAAALLTSGEKAAITPELAESGAAKPTFGENAVASNASGEHAAATPASEEIVSATPTLAAIVSTTPTSGENAAATPTSGENAAATPTSGEIAAAIPTLVAIVSATAISGEIAAATPTYGESTTATPAFAVGAAAIPTPGENTAATSTSREIAAATPMLIEIVSATPTHGENAVATPAPGENAVAISAHGENVYDNPTHGENAVATPTRGENVSDNSTSGENVSENPTPGENAAAALVPGRHGVGGKRYGCMERKGHISSAQGHLHERPRSAVGKLTCNLRTNNELHRAAPATGTGDSVHGKNQRSREIQMGLCKRTDACKDSVQSGAAILAEAAAAVRDNAVAAKWNEFQKAMLKRAKRLGSRGLQSGRGA
jgi:hypothetical protein